MLPSLPNEIYAKIFTDDREEKSIRRARLINKDIAEEARYFQHLNYIEDIVMMPLTVDDINDNIYNSNCIVYDIEIENNKKYYSSHIIYWSNEAGPTTASLTSSFLIVKYEQLASGKIQKNFTIKADYYDGRPSDVIDDELPLYIIGNEGYTLVSLNIARNTYFNRLSMSTYFGKTLDQFLLDEGVAEYNIALTFFRTEARRLMKRYYNENIERLRRYDPYLLLFFLVSELNFILTGEDDEESYKPNYLNLNEEIDTVKNMLEVNWFKRNGYEL